MEAVGVSRASSCTSIDHTFPIHERLEEQAGYKKAFQHDGKRRILEHCGKRVFAHYPVGIWLMASADCMGGPRATTPQRCSGADWSVYRQCVLEGCRRNSNTTQVQDQCDDA
ncbi:hypothetical protein TNCV_3103321 [Trichonephila clavipes]|nr:hypothetical protein TNCV_3103321 [Trichonephila clavipes]